MGIVIEAVERLFEVKEIHDPRLLLIVGFIGLFINLIGLVIFGHAHSHNIPAVIAEDSSDDEDSDSDDEEAELNNRNEIQCTDNLIEKANNLEVESNREQDILSSNSSSKIYKDLTVENNKNNGPTLLVMEKTDANKKNNNKKEKLNDSGNKSNKSKKSTTKCQILSNEANMNMRAVFLHVLADALGSIIVIISALLNIFRNELKIPTSVINYVDPVLCLGLVILILSSTIPLCMQ